jgi:hypothetical protein
MKDRLFQDLEGILDHYGYIAVWSDKNETTPFQHLIVKLTKDEKDRERALIVKLDENALTTPLDLETSKVTESFVELCAILPFEVPTESTWHILRILNFINQALVAPCFAFDEISGRIMCRYTFLKPGSTISGPTFISLVGMILLWLDVFSRSIEEIAQGKTTEEVITMQASALTKAA